MCFLPACVLYPVCPATLRYCLTVGPLTWAVAGCAATALLWLVVGATPNLLALPSLSPASFRSCLCPPAACMLQSCP